MLQISLSSDGLKETVIHCLYCAPEVVLLAPGSGGACGAVKLDRHLKPTTPYWSVQAGSQTQRSLKLAADPQIVILWGSLSERMDLNVTISEELAALEAFSQKCYFVCFLHGLCRSL